MFLIHTAAFTNLFQYINLNILTKRFQKCILAIALAETLRRTELVSNDETVGNSQSLSVFLSFFLYYSLSDYLSIHSDFSLPFPESIYLMVMTREGGKERDRSLSGVSPPISLTIAHCSLEKTLNHGAENMIILGSQAQHYKAIRYQDATTTSFYALFNRGLKNRF